MSTYFNKKRVIQHLLYMSLKVCVIQYAVLMKLMSMCFAVCLKIITLGKNCFCYYVMIP